MKRIILIFAIMIAGAVKVNMATGNETLVKKIFVILPAILWVLDRFIVDKNIKSSL